MPAHLLLVAVAGLLVAVAVLCICLVSLSLSLSLSLSPLSLLLAPESSKDGFFFGGDVGCSLLSLCSLSSLAKMRAKKGFPWSSSVAWTRGISRDDTHGRQRGHLKCHFNILDDFKL